MKLFPRVMSLAAIVAAGAASTLQAQEVKPCATDEVRREMIKQNPDLLRQEAEYEAGLQEYLQMRAGLREGDDSTIYVLPLVFHVLYDPTSTSDAHNISDEQIMQAVDVLNRDYAKLNPDTVDICCGYQSIAANPRLRFQLATKDPFGNCTNGIDRITSIRATNAQDYSKLNPWFRQHYINIWVVRTMSGSAAGYSQYPSNVQGDMGALRDGVVVLHDYVGEIGTGNPFRARTLTHEIGHFLNLAHTWGSTNEPTVECGDDGVDDTPVTKGHDNCLAVDLYDSFCSYMPLDTFYTFQNVTLTSGTTDPTPAPVMSTEIPNAPAVVYSQPKAVGVSANSQVAGSFSFSDWGVGAPDSATTYAELTGTMSLSDYYEFTLTPELGRSMTLSGLSFWVDRAANGPRTFAVRSSIVGYNANLSSSVDTNGLQVVSPNVIFFRNDSAGTRYKVNITVSGDSYRNLPGPATFRIYAWNAEDASGHFTVDSLAVAGQFGIIENTQNYMEYSYCTHMFTLGQKDRMRAALNSEVSSRNNLWTDGNHQYTGINGYELTCAPQAGFYTMTQFVCPGTNVQFKDNSSHATPTSWSWTFEGGNPATSDQQNPMVSFNDPGPHNVTLTVSNDNGSSTTSKWNAVVVSSNYNEMADPMHEPFNGQNEFNRWNTVNYEGNASYWHWNGSVGHNAAGSAMLNASNTYTLVQDLFSSPDAYLADVDLLVTPNLALPFANNLNVSFWYAYSTQSSTTTDVTEQLRVYASSNCGQTWLLRETLEGGDLVTAGVRSAGYTPTGDEWREASFTLPSSFAGSQVRLKFEFTSSLASNDLFIDDINIGASNVGIAEVGLNGNLGLMPNPATNHLTVMVDLAGSDKGTLTFMDMTGRTIHTEAVQAGVQEMQFDLEKMGLSRGVYLVQLKHANGQRTGRLVVR